MTEPRQCYVFTPEGIKGMSDQDAIMTFATLTGHNEDQEQTNTLITAIQMGFRLAKGKETPYVDYEHSHQIIKAFAERFQRVFSGDFAQKVKDSVPTTFTGKDGQGRPMEYDEWRVAREINKQGLPQHVFSSLFEKYLFGDWMNRKLVVQWFHEQSQIPDDSAPTEIKNAEFGNGLFASRDIKQGELISYYPMDWVSDSHLCPTNDNNEPYSIDQQKWICIQNAGIIGYGNPHDKQGNPERILKELREAEGRMTHRINDYGFSFSGEDGYVHIWGDPLTKQPNSWFRGCIANDGGYFIGQTPEGYRKEFMKMTVNDKNSKCNTLLNTRMTATRDIKKGEEILTIYGEDYWFGGSIQPDGTMEKVKEEMVYEPCHAVLIRDAYNKLESRGQKKKAKEKKKKLREHQDETFKEFREKLAESPSNPDNNKWRVCICEVNQKGSGIDVKSVICGGVGELGWIDGDPTQFSTFY